MIENDVLTEKERVKQECFKQVENILNDKRQGKVKNKSYPIKKISVILYHLYGISVLA